MKKLGGIAAGILALGISFASCNRGITPQQAADHGGRCGQHLRGAITPPKDPNASQLAVTEAPSNTAVAAPEMALTQ